MKDGTAKNKFIMLGRIVKSGVTNFFRNAWLTVAATAVMVVALTIILFAVVLNVTARNAITELSKNLKISVYLKDGTTDEQRQTLQQALQSNQYTAGIEYVSTEQAKERFSQSFQGEEQLIEGLTLVGGDTLPASLEVSVNNIDKINEVADIARGEQHQTVVESITLGKTDARKTIDRAAAIQRFITTASLLAALIFAGVSVLIIFNTIRMTIFTRSEEIRIMKLIGATPNFIRGPFLVEASMYGVIAALVAMVAVYSMIVSVGAKVATQAEFQPTYEFFTQASTIALLVASTIVAGVLVGVVSSMLAMEKHLKLNRW